MDDKEKLETAECCLQDIEQIINSDNKSITMITDIGLVISFWKAAKSGQIKDDPESDPTMYIL